MKTDWNETFKFEEQENDLEQLTTANSDINGSIESLSGKFIQTKKIHYHNIIFFVMAPLSVT